MKVGTTSFILTALWAAHALAAPAIHRGEKLGSQDVDAEDAPQEYIVLFDADFPQSPEVESVLREVELTADDEHVHVFRNSAFKGFAANVKTAAITKLEAMRVSDASPVSILEKSVKITSADVREQVPWGLQRISTEGEMVGGNPARLDFTYTFEAEPGKGVDIYIVDTGVNTEHKVFGGRAKQGFAFDNDPTDGDGHGTHCAGTAAGDFFGISSAANVIAVKVLGADGSGSSTDALRGMDWIIDNHLRRKAEPGFVGSVMSMSWGLGQVSPAVDQAIALATKEGIHVSVAAGNSAEDTCRSSPGSAAGNQGPAVAVGSVNIGDRVSSFSNSGQCTDVYAPGEQVLSSWVGGDNVVNFLSGTSMACPHVTGIMAYLMARDPKLAQDPSTLKNLLRTSSLADLVAGRTFGGDDKLLANNGERGEPPAPQQQQQRGQLRKRAAVELSFADLRWHERAVEAVRGLFRRGAGVEGAARFVVKSREAALRF